MKKSHTLAAALLGATLTIGTGTLALATPDDEPTPACVEARAALDLALVAIVDLNPNVYPEDAVPAVEDVTPALLDAVLADADLGAGGRAEVKAALAAFVAVEEACAVETPASTTTPTSTATATPTPTLPADEDDDFDQVGTPPVGGVATGSQ